MNDMMEHPLVSVIIPNYNHASFLEERINSVLNQTYNNIELIILDDKSSDNSKEILSKYQAHPLVSYVFFNDINSGSPFKQWEKGFLFAKGELIWIAESDDCCSPVFLKTLIVEFEKDPNCVLAFCKSVKIDIQGKRLEEVGLPAKKKFEGNRFVGNYLSRYNYIENASSALFAKRTLKSVDKCYTQYRGCGDWIFWIEVAKCGNVSYINEALNYFRQHGTNTTAQQTKNGKGELEVVDVTNHLRNKGYIGYKEYLRSKVVHMYSVRHGKLSGLLSKDIKNGIRSKWKAGPVVELIVSLIYVLHCCGISLIKR